MSAPTDIDIAELERQWPPLDENGRIPQARCDRWGGRKMNAWIVERWIANKLHFWSPGARGRGYENDWAMDIDFAVRLAREQDAFLVLLECCHNEGRIAEHVWVDMPSAKVDATSGEKADG